MTGWRRDPCVLRRGRLTAVWAASAVFVVAAAGMATSVVAELLRWWPRPVTLVVNTAATLLAGGAIIALSLVVVRMVNGPGR